jgi:hypothetical protein
LKILLDEGVPKIIQKRLSNLSISNVEEMGWRGIKNGELLDLMSGQFQILVTTDKNLPSQQNLKKRCYPRSTGLLPPLKQESSRN